MDRGQLGKAAMALATDLPVGPWESIHEDDRDKWSALAELLVAASEPAHSALMGLHAALEGLDSIECGELRHNGEFADFPCVRVPGHSGRHMDEDGEWCDD